MNPSATEPTPRSNHRPWRAALGHALPAGALIMALFGYWFAIADRHIVFLYHHDMGPLYPDTSPFSRVTASRYWMAGLVAAGALLLLYTTANWALGRLSANYRPPAWQRVWALCAIILLAAVPTLTMTANTPTLPAGQAARVTLVVLLAVGLALWFGQQAAQRPAELLWLAADGLGMALLMLNLIHVEKLARWLARNANLWIIMMVICLLAGLAWLTLVTALRLWLRRPIPPAGSLLAAGACIAYLLLPLVHHLLGTDGYYYLTDSDNFFAQQAAVQLATWLLSAGLALGLTAFRRRAAER